MTLPSPRSLALLLPLLAVACGGDDGSPPPGEEPGPTGGADFTLALAAPSLEVRAGENGTLGVSLARSGGFSDVVTFEVEGVPASAAAQFSPSPTTGSSSTLTLVIPRTLAPGGYALRVKATSGFTPPGLTRTAPLALTVTAPQD